MSRREAFTRLLAGISADLAAYAALATLLEQQFRAIVAHDAQGLQAVGATVLERVAELDRRRAERVALVQALGVHGGERPVERVFEQLPPAARETALQAWMTLEARLHVCRDRNTRNCELLMGQRARLAELDGGEADTYAPA
ncbi:hypothetical protein CKO44_23860 [Rubrivivax gelatinosus]|uniref:Flagella synthesis protein FlgN n=1 Tax=Rubrivivax gelatinosus TaxID=28068 RepID=A0ABS1E0W6_RUBGE|nr:hypothetical protein [Rubrivivax gelatinosus]MBK1715694.1 hypothetical protein [Rubrivivax gelatinosus]